MSIREEFNQLPVSAIADEVNASLAIHSRLIISAPPGAGKSTLLPLTLLENFQEGKILVMEPRRIAARHVAERMASMMGENVGATVGYKMRFDSRISKDTGILYTSPSQRDAHESRMPS